jgi:tetratricopeptide (TPR) repeat protein
VTGSLRRRPLLSALLVLACLALTVGSVWLVVYPQAWAAHHWRQAELSAQRGDFLRAREHLERCLEVWGTSGETHFQMGRICRRAGDFERARKHLEEARRLRWPPGAIDFELLLVQIQATGARGTDASTIQHIIYSNQHPDEKLILEALVKGYMQNFYLREAEFWLNYWIDEHPEDWVAYYWRGQLRERFGKLEEACADYRHALELSPEQLDSELRLAQALQQKGIDLAEAKQRFERYLAVHPQHGEALLGLARCQRGLGDRTAARETLARIAPTDKTYPKCLLLHALLESDEENYAKALVHLRKAEELSPTEPDILHQMADVLHHLGKETEAREYQARQKQLEQDLKRLAETIRGLMSDPGDVTKRFEAGSILLKAGQEDGVRWLLTVLQEDPDHRPTHAALAEYYARSTDPERQRLAEIHRRRAEATSANKSPSS